MEKASVTEGGKNQKAHAKYVAWAFLLRGIK